MRRVYTFEEHIIECEKICNAFETKNSGRKEHFESKLKPRADPEKKRRDNETTFNRKMPLICKQCAPKNSYEFPSLFIHPPRIERSVFYIEIRIHLIYPFSAPFHRLLKNVVDTMLDSGLASSFSMSRIEWFVHRYYRAFRIRCIWIARMFWHMMRR